MDLQKMISKSNPDNTFTVNLKICYDPHEDIKHFVKGKRSRKFQIDSVFRSGREKRSSGFFLCQTLYSEWIYSDKLWPDVNIGDMSDSINLFGKRQRRFGK
jgi:undecaprenyl diphosphate synthase